MNLVNQFVKKSILSYFSIFPTREHVLNHLLLTIGNGYEWGKDAEGFYVPVGGGGLRVLDKIPPFTLVGTERESVFQKEHQANVEFQSLLIDWANKHIDVISTRWFHFYGHAVERTRLYRWCDKYSLLANLPDNLHPDWEEACRAFAQDCLVRVRQEGVPPAVKAEELVEFVKERMPEWYEITKVCVAAMEKLHDPVHDALVGELLKDLGGNKDVIP